MFSLLQISSFLQSLSAWGASLLASLQFHPQQQRHRVGGRAAEPQNTRKNRSSRGATFTERLNLNAQLEENNLLLISLSAGAFWRNKDVFKMHSSPEYVQEIDMRG